MVKHYQEFRMSVFQAMNVDRRFVLRNDNTLVDMEGERQRLGVGSTASPCAAPTHMLR